MKRRGLSGRVKLDRVCDRDQTQISGGVECSTAGMFMIAEVYDYRHWRAGEWFHAVERHRIVWQVDIHNSVNTPSNLPPVDVTNSLYSRSAPPFTFVHKEQIFEMDMFVMHDTEPGIHLSDDLCHQHSPLQLNDNPAPPS